MTKQKGSGGIMEVLVPIAIVLVAIAGLGGSLAGFVFLWRRQRRSGAETAELMRLVQHRGWTYQQSDYGSADRFSGGEPFPTASRNLRVWDLITGTYRGRPFCCFEYRRKDYSPGGSTTDRDQDYFRVFAVRTPAQRPKVEVKEAGFGSKVLDLVGAKDLSLDHPEFDEAFRVTTDNDRFARDVLNIDTRQWLLQDQRARDLPFRFERDEAVTWQRGRLRPGSIDPSLDYLCDLLDRVPDFVWR